MHRSAASFVFAALLAQSGNVSAEDLTLVLPHALGPGGIAWLQVQVGPIGRGRQIDVTTSAGRRLGTISPFGARSGQDAGTYTLPVPADAIRDGRLSVRLTISQAGAPPREPTAEELPNVKLIVPDATQ